MPGKKLETVKEASQSSGLPQSSLYELVAKAKENPGDPRNIPYVQIESRIYFRTGALDHWFERLELEANNGNSAHLGAL